jgi:hypothetical protein
MGAMTSSINEATKENNSRGICDENEIRIDSRYLNIRG